MTEFKEGNLVRISMPPRFRLRGSSLNRLLDGRTGLVVGKIERASFHGGDSLFHVFLGPVPNRHAIQTFGATWLELVSEAEDD